MTAEAKYSIEWSEDKRNIPERTKKKTVKWQCLIINLAQYDLDFQESRGTNPKRN